MDIEIKPKNRFLKKWLLPSVAVACVAGCIVWAIAAGNSRSVRASTDGVLTAEAENGLFEDNIRVNGRVETGTVVQISTLETGIVERKWVEEGAVVKPGDIIVTLANPNLRQQILDSESQLAEKQNMLRDTELAMEKDRLQMKQDLLTAHTEMNRKKRLADQQEKLYAENLTSHEDWLQAREDYDLARESLKLIQNRLHQDSLYRGTQLAMMRESLDNMRENFTLVRQRAENLNLRATHGGQIGSLDVELGQNIPAGQQIGQINILGNYKLSVLIDEHYIDRVQPGIAGVAKRQNVTFPLTVTKVYPEVKDGKFKADLTIAGNTDASLRVGQSYPIDIQLGAPTQAVIIPRGGFFQSTGGKWIYVLDADRRTARRRAITIGRQNPRYYEVTDGLEPGETVLISSYTTYGDAETINFSDRL